jgi:hypothetical protein
LLVRNVDFLVFFRLCGFKIWGRLHTTTPTTTKTTNENESENQEQEIRNWIFKERNTNDCWLVNW